MKVITIRGVDDVTNKYLKDKANSQGLSKEEFLRRKLKEMVLMDFNQYELEKYTHLVEYMTDVIKHQTEVMERLEQKLDEI